MHHRSIAAYVSNGLHMTSSHESLRDSALPDDVLRFGWDCVDFASVVLKDNDHLFPTDVLNVVLEGLGRGRVASVYPNQGRIDRAKDAIVELLEDPAISQALVAPEFYHDRARPDTVKGWSDRVHRSVEDLKVMLDPTKIQERAAEWSDVEASLSDLLDLALLTTYIRNTGEGKCILELGDYTYTQEQLQREDGYLFNLDVCDTMIRQRAVQITYRVFGLSGGWETSYAPSSSDWTGIMVLLDAIKSSITWEDQVQPLPINKGELCLYLNSVPLESCGQWLVSQIHSEAR